MNKKFVIHFILGIIVALIAAFIMFDGRIFGEDHASIATIICNTGIGIIGSSIIWTLKSSFEGGKMSDIKD